MGSNIVIIRKSQGHQKPLMGELIVITEVDFALEEYKSLRTEISETIERSYKTLSLGVGGITVILGFVFEYEIYELFFVLPFLIIANSYRYKAYTSAIINAGDYIKKIENSIYRKNSALPKSKEKVFGDMGWENSIKREIYKSHTYAATIIFASLYFMCVIGAWQFNKDQLANIPFGTLIIVLYVILGLFFWLYDKIKDILNKKKVSIAKL